MPKKKKGKRNTFIGTLKNFSSNSSFSEEVFNEALSGRRKKHRCKYYLDKGLRPNAIFLII
jgi:hypothetical protein